jgi:opacity protein-like surface antigen
MDSSRRNDMKKSFAVLAAVLLLAPGLAFCNSFSLRAGYFFPRAQHGIDVPDSLWTIEFDNMSFKKADFTNSILGFSYEYFLTRELSLEFSVDFYNRVKVGTYKDWVGYSFDDGDYAFPSEYYWGDFNVSHSLTFSLIPVQVALKILPLGRRTKVIPYLGGGVGAYIWGVRLRGDMIDFSDEYVYTDPDLGEVSVYKIQPTQAEEETRFSFGFHWFAGLMVPIANRLSLEAEFKQHLVNAGKFTDAFEGFDKFDLSGYQVTVGINYWF